MLEQSIRPRSHKNPFVLTRTKFDILDQTCGF